MQAFPQRDFEQKMIGRHEVLRVLVLVLTSVEKEMKANGRERFEIESEESHAKRMKVDDKHLLINDFILDEKFKAEFKEAFRDEKDYIHERGAVLNTYPFKHCIINNFVKDENFLKNLKTELLELKFQKKSNDLYQFRQSNDLKTSTKKNISNLRRLLYKDCLDWITTVTDIPLDGSAIDMSCAKYSNTDVLLCHDDELEGRRIAYIFYLVSEWNENDGGTLDLYTTDEFGQPKETVKSLVPEWNSLVFFEVTPISFHQVSEVLSDKTRLSISGWFHGPPIVRPSPHKELAPAKQSPIHLKDDILISWVNPMYLQIEIVSDMRQNFEDNSEIELEDFLLKEKYDALLKELEEGEVTWRICGPANKRRYEKAVAGSLGGVVQECIQLFKSEPMFKLFTTFTGLKLSDVDIEERDADDIEDEAEEVINPEKRKKMPEQTSDESTVQDESKDTDKTYSCHGEVCRWSRGCYTLIHDNDPEASEMALDSMFFIGCDGWQEDFGGYTSYLAREEDEELLTVYPCSNSLALVYRDTETLKFVKHINNRFRAAENHEEGGTSTKSILPHYYNLMLTYFE